MMYFAWTFFAYSKNFIIYVDRYLGDVSNLLMHVPNCLNAMSTLTQLLKLNNT